MASESNLLAFARDAEDAAAGLLRFRDSLPRYATSLTADVGQLFHISRVLREIHEARSERRYGPSYYRIRDDLDLVSGSLGMTLRVVLDMFDRSQDRPTGMAWEDLEYRFDNEEGFPLLERLDLYHNFLNAQLAVLEGERQGASGTLRTKVQDMFEAQRAYRPQSGGRRRRVIDSGSSTPRQRSRSRPRSRARSRPRPRRMQTPVSPTVVSDDWDTYSFGRDGPPPMVPDPPPPLSPTFTSGSSHSMSSSHTSYSSGQFYPDPPLVHWAHNVFNGTNPNTEYKRAFQVSDLSSCHGTPEPLALQNLLHDGFRIVLEHNFETDGLGVRLYWREQDSRARILIMTRDRHNRQQTYYCQPLANLKTVRDDSSLQLCRASRTTGRYHLWARLVFASHERMVLFYSTFVAMKSQDPHGPAHADLVDNFELEVDEGHGEEQLFGGQIRHNDMTHAVRLWLDRPSGCVRLEASALRGPRKDIPIWTAFVTRSAHDPDWANLISERTVALPAMRPPPYTFILRYEPPYDGRARHYLLPFTSSTGSYIASFLTFSPPFSFDRALFSSAPSANSSIFVSRCARLYGHVDRALPQPRQESLSHGRKMLFGSVE